MREKYKQINKLTQIKGAELISSCMHTEKNQSKR